MSLQRLSTQALANDVDEVLISSLDFPSSTARRSSLVKAFCDSGLDGAALWRLGAEAAATQVVTDVEAQAASASGDSKAVFPEVSALTAAFQQLLTPPVAVQGLSDKDGGLGAVDVECRDPAAEIMPYLCLGGRCAAENLPHLRFLGVTHVLNVADDVECFFPEDLTYLHREIRDGGGDDRIVGVFEEAAAFVRDAIEKGGRVFVHCYAGINRSATVAMAILMQLEGWTLKEAHDHIYERRWISPFEGNCSKVARWELKTRGTCSMEDWLGDSGS